MDKTIDAVDVRAAQYVIGHQCPAGDASKIERGHCAWCNAYWLIEDMWNLLEPSEAKD